MPNPAFLEPSFSGIENKIPVIGDYGTTTEIIINGTNPEVLCEESSEIRYAILSISGADVYALVDNNTNVSASQVNHSFIFNDGDTWTDFRLGKQRFTVSADDGQTAVIKKAIANQEIIVI